MEAGSSRSVTFLNSDTVRRWISRAFILSIVVYLVVLGYLIFESVTGASKWAPYGVNIALFISLIIGSEIVMLVTGIQIFREDAGIWPPEIKEGWDTFKSGAWLKGAGQMLIAAWDISLIDLRLRSGNAILMGRLNRIASIVPLAYALIASAGGAPWGLRGSALFDIGLAVVVWAFMEMVMVQPEEPAADVPVAVPADEASPGRQEAYAVRRVEAADIARVAELEVRKWKEQAASHELIAERLANYPEGQLCAVQTTFANGSPVRSRIVAWCTLMPATAAHVETHPTWSGLTANGTLAALDRDGSILIGVNLISVTEGGTFILSAEALATVVERGMDKLVTGSRLTGFVSFNKRRESEGKPPLSADDYASLREIRGFRLNEERLDAGESPLSNDEYRARANSLRAEAGQPPLAHDDAPDFVSSNVRAYMSVPGTRIVRVAPGYIEDAASADYGVLMEWPNPVPRPLRLIPLVNRFVARRIRAAIRGEWEQQKQQRRERASARRGSVPAYLRREAATRQPTESKDAEQVPVESHRGHTRHR